MKKECILLDVFTITPFTGNQLAVFPEADDLSTDQMQNLANEINYSETTFILKSPDDQADFDVRIFTPRSELPFAGHPMIGTAYVLLEHLNKVPGDGKCLRLRTKVGVIPLEKKDGRIWMRQNQPRFSAIFKDKQEVAGLVGLKAGDISDDLPVEEVSTGNSVLLVPIKNLSSIREATGIADKIVDFFSKTESMAPYLFTFETEGAESSVHTRLFAPHLGIIEDPATGSAAGPLTAYLLKHKVFGESFEIQNEQGIELGRPSRIMMKGRLDNETYTIEIGGQSRLTGTSTFNL